MKRIFGAFLCTLLCFSLAGCAVPHGEIAATTLPVAEFTERICAGTGLTVTRLVTEPVSCLHDYTLHEKPYHHISHAALSRGRTLHFPHLRRAILGRSA